MKELHFNAVYTDKELLNILKEYAQNVKFPTSREFIASNNLPCARVYIDRFGSFQEAIIKSGIKIPKEKQRYFNRVQLTDDELLHKLKEEVLKSGKLLTAKEISKNKNLPSNAVYFRRFGNLENVYSLIGMETLNNDLFKEKLKSQFLELFKFLGRTPTSRDLDKYSKKGMCASASTYSHHFGGMDALQRSCNLTPTKKLNKSKQEMIDDIKFLAEELGRTPTQCDLVNYSNIHSVKTYCDRFGSFVKALKEAGFESNKHKIYYTKTGVPCYSRMEHLFAQMLIKFQLDFKKDVKYSDYISDENRKITCDFVVNLNDKEYFVEIFGIEGNEHYEGNKIYKELVCKNNNIPLIALNKENFWRKKQIDIYNDFISLVEVI